VGGGDGELKTTSYFELSAKSHSESEGRLFLYFKKGGKPGRIRLFQTKAYGPPPVSFDWKPPPAGT